METMDSALRIKPNFSSNCIWKSMGTDKGSERERESSLTVQYKAKWKNSRNEISIDCFSSQRFPRDWSSRGGMARIMDRSAKQLPLLSARLSGPGHYLGYNTFQKKSTTKTVWVVILMKVYGKRCLPTHSPLPLQPLTVNNNHIAFRKRNAVAFHFSYLFI